MIFDLPFLDFLITKISTIFFEFWVDVGFLVQLVGDIFEFFEIFKVHQSDNWVSTFGEEKVIVCYGQIGYIAKFASCLGDRDDIGWLKTHIYY
ncbi:MAG: hypothetical protein UW41_C0031G0001 [Candidatus Collierbacteria bacterium GW2011_GWC2_44_18]|uniref:Uncharacterized protein n=1 Tax=Candidatus Collierbacteria bacterium GW2011_GWC2_44_18 TaxID=1618392 RepID=A0A0G1KK95_9BACT|nr:MAG: hypothetical protein US48_C0013G0001 [Candidatus Levybacteria bacterium GW2011_GWA2_37_36]KKT29148.1 MAG: hypothetical protein UW16_C0034G0001 [Microgenomates group bacterium GW2011_GWC1_44_10]KKT48374.1 MAG: hypothetical protein UW41_C0031G0001 [Candidatus Collierbacteria bacterium GW2011_GWC2_44_18]